MTDLTAQAMAANIELAAEILDAASRTLKDGLDAAQAEQRNQAAGMIVSIPDDLKDALVLIAAALTQNRLANR